MHWRRLSMSAVAILIGFAPPAARAGAWEDEALTAYDTYCIQGVLRPQRLLERLKEVGAEQASPIIAAEFLKQGGKTWSVRGSRGGSFTVFLTDTGACGVVVQHVHYATIVSGFEKRIAASFIEKEDSDAQTLMSYAVNAPTAKAGDEPRVLALLLAGKIGISGAKREVVLSVIPKGAFDKAGVEIAWPAR